MVLYGPGATQNSLISISHYFTPAKYHEKRGWFLYIQEGRDGLLKKKSTLIFE
jgi:hypothetical protein